MTEVEEMRMNNGLCMEVEALAEDLRGAGGVFPATTPDAEVQRELGKALLSPEVYDALVKRIRFQQTGEWRG